MRIQEYIALILLMQTDYSQEFKVKACEGVGDPSDLVTRVLHKQNATPNSNMYFGF